MALSPFRELETLRNHVADLERALEFERGRAEELRQHALDVERLLEESSASTAELQAHADELAAELAELRAAAGPYPPGHYYSPVPDPAEREARLARFAPEREPLAEIDLRPEHQRALIEAFGAYAAELPFPDEPDPACRYHYGQKWFGQADAIFLYSMLRHHAPARIVEVGSGFSSAVMLETVERFLPHTQLTFIEPYTERLRALLRPDDQARCTILESPVQQLPLVETFGDLRAGDLLFIDSSHVVKYGSDLQWLLFEVLPHLPEGVFVHFHDVFFPFEYPRDWVEEGKAWNEVYMLRALLSHSAHWSVHAWNHYACHVLRETVAAHLPRCLENPGGSLYLQRTAAP